LLESGAWPIVLVPHVSSTVGRVEGDDHAFMSELVRRAGHAGGRLRLLEPTLDAAELKWVIAHVRLFAGARTHSTLAAISSGVPTICLGYSAKARGICRDVYGHEKWLVDAVALDPAQFCDLLLELDEQAESIREHLRQVVPHFRDLATSAAGYLRLAMEEHERRSLPHSSGEKVTNL
jgi:polysaccharide pyruvyl transferase WcaK-like protein